MVTATYSDSSSKEVTDYTTNPANEASLDDTDLTSVSVSYAENEVTKSTSFTVTVLPTYTVTFNSNGGSSVDKQEGLLFGDKVIEPTVPNKNNAYLCKFYGWYENEEFDGEAWNFDNNLVTKDITLYAKWVAYELGDEGPGGGKIFYVSTEGFEVKGGTIIDFFTGYDLSFDTYTAYYFEAAPVNTSPTQWGLNNGAFVERITTTQNNPPDDISASNYNGNISFIGQGRHDTMQIISWHSFYSVKTSAAHYAVAYRGPNNKDDWFLPSLSELALYYHSSVTEQKPTDGRFWSSSQYNSGIAWVIHFNDGLRWTSSKGNSDPPVRTVRAF